MLNVSKVIAFCGHYHIFVHNSCLVFRLGKVTYRFTLEKKMVAKQTPQVILEHFTRVRIVTKSYNKLKKEINRR